MIAVVLEIKDDGLVLICRSLIQFSEGGEELACDPALVGSVKLKSWWCSGELFGLKIALLFMIYIWSCRSCWDTWSWIQMICVLGTSFDSFTLIKGKNKGEKKKDKKSIPE